MAQERKGKKKGRGALNRGIRWNIRGSTKSHVWIIRVWILEKINRRKQGIYRELLDFVDLFLDQKVRLMSWMDWDFLAVAGMVQQIVPRWSGGRVEESKGKDVSSCSLPYKWRPFSFRLVLQTQIFHLPQRTPCGMYNDCLLLVLFNLDDHDQSLKSHGKTKIGMTRYWRPFFMEMGACWATILNYRRV